MTLIEFHTKFKNEKNTIILLEDKRIVLEIEKQNPYFDSKKGIE
jgi:hypothetical protein